MCIRDRSSPLLGQTRFFTESVLLGLTKQHGFQPAGKSDLCLSDEELTCLLYTSSGLQSRGAISRLTPFTSRRTERCTRSRTEGATGLKSSGFKRLNTPLLLRGIASFRNETVCRPPGLDQTTILQTVQCKGLSFFRITTNLTCLLYTSTQIVQAAERACCL